MKMNKYILLLSLLVVIFGCKEQSTKTPNLPISTTAEVKQDIPQQVTFIADMDHLRMRDSAGKDGKIIGNFSAGEELIYSGIKSDFTTPVKLRGYPYNDPWLKIKTKSGEEG